MALFKVFTLLCIGITLTYAAPAMQAANEQAAQNAVAAPAAVAPAAAPSNAMQALKALFVGGAAADSKPSQSESAVVQSKQVLPNSLPEQAPSNLPAQRQPLPVTLPL